MLVPRSLKVTTMSDDSDLVTLRGGYVVPLAVLRLAWSLEDRGCSVTIEPGDVLAVGPRDRLTEADCDAIKRWKPALIELTKYCETVSTEEIA
jgi:hypothetical protein